MHRRGIVAAAFVLASCGSDGGGSSSQVGVISSAPTPTPSPTPTPTPTPTPSPTPTYVGYTPIDQLTGTTTLLTAGTKVYTAFTPPQYTGLNGFGSRFNVGYDASGQNFSIQGVNTSLSETFNKNERDATTASNVFRYIKANGDSLLISPPVVPGGTVKYFRYLDYFIKGVSTDPLTTQEYLSIVGNPILSADLPAQGVISFTRTGVSGVAYVSDSSKNYVTYDLVNSTMTITVDLNAQTITSHIVVVGTPRGGGSDVPLVTIDAISDFAGNATAKTSSSSFVNIRSVVLTGALFGPHAEEAGSAFVLDGLTQDNGKEVQIIGLGAGAR